jgi:integrase/recombinase XerD
VPPMSMEVEAIELYRAAMEERGLAAPTIDRRLSTVCGFYRFAHIDGRIASNPARYVRRPKVQPSEGHGMDRAELGTFLFTAERFDRDHAALAVLLGLNGLRVSEACGTNIEDLAVQRGHRTLRILGKGNKPATIPLVPRTARNHRLVRRGATRRTDPAPQRRPAPGPAHRSPMGPLDRQTRRTRSRPSAHAPRRFHHADPRTTTIYDRPRERRTIPSIGRPTSSERSVRARFSRVVPCRSEESAT